MRLVLVALGAGLLCGLGFGLGFDARARSAPAAARVVVAHAPAVLTPSARDPLKSAPKRVEGTTESAGDADSGTELDAVVETAAALSLPANTPMAEGDAAAHLARAWRSVLGTHPSEQTVAVLWAQWAHETARGRRMHAYNFAGIKGRGPSGASVVVWTREGSTSSDLVRRTFRAYRAPSEGARDYVRLLADRYPSALRAARDGNALSFVSALDQGGYFTGDTRAYLRAVSSLSVECRRRGLWRVTP
jgi:hypothetical protein